MRDAVNKPSVLFVCVKNAGKSQMAAGLMRKHAGGTVQVYSAGTSPGRSINELSAEALTEVGVDITEESLNSLTRNWCATSTLWSPSGERLTSTRSPAPVSRVGTPTSRANAASTASNACAWSATTSRGSRIFTLDSKGILCKTHQNMWACGERVGTAPSAATT
jgi:hypothetical protein